MSKSYINEVGNVYGNLTVIQRGEFDPKGVLWICKCLCGIYTTVRATNLRNNSTKSCGCLTSGGHEKGKRGRQRVNQLNDLFFKQESPVSCYWAGFVAADGNIPKNKNAIRITLAIKDREHSQQFAKDLNLIYKLKVKQGAYPSCRLEFTSKTIVHDLETKFKITPNKSLTLEYPEFSALIYEDAFILGYIDGDGYIQKAVKPRIEILGTFAFLTGIKKRFDMLLQHNNVSIRPKGNGNIFTLILHGDNARRIFNHYKNINVPKLERKWVGKDELYNV